MYFVDVRGLEAQSVFASAQFGSPLDPRDVGAANADPWLEAEGAVSLAESSGGFSVQNRNDLEAGLRRIARESQVYYLLGYAPSEGRPTASSGASACEWIGLTSRFARGRDITREESTSAPISTPMRQ